VGDLDGHPDAGEVGEQVLPGAAGDVAEVDVGDDAAGDGGDGGG